MGSPNISVRIGMPVLASDGRLLGDVERISPVGFKLRQGSTADGRAHDIPWQWLDRVESGTAHLNRAATEEATLTALGTPRGLRESVRRLLPWLLGALGAIMLVALMLAN